MWFFLLLFQELKNKAAANVNDVTDAGKRISPTSDASSGMRRLQDEINNLTKKNCGNALLFFSFAFTNFRSVF